MNEMLKKIIEADENALNSLEAFSNAAKKLGYSQKEIDEALEQADGFPLDDDELDEIAGGYNNSRPSHGNLSNRPK